MIERTFGKAPFKMNWKYLVNQSKQPLSDYYSSLRQINSLMEKVEGTKVNSNRFGAYLFTNNFMLALHGLIKSIESKNNVCIVVTERQILEQSIILEEIFDKKSPEEQQGWDKILANIRLYAGYILWVDQKNHAKALESDDFKASFKQVDDEFSKELEEDDLKSTDIPSLMFHNTKNLIKSLKLDYLHSQLDRFEKELERTPSLLEVIKRHSKSMTSAYSEGGNIMGGIFYKELSRITHGSFNTLLATRFSIQGGSDIVKTFNGEHIVIQENVDKLTGGVTGLFNHLWPKECSLENLAS